MNIIKNVANLLGLELYEVFQIKYPKHNKKYKFFYMITKDGLFYDEVFEGEYRKKSQSLEGLILGNNEIIKLNKE